MKLEILVKILRILKRAPHVGFESNFPCDLEKIGSPGRPYRDCTCGLDEIIKEVENNIEIKNNEN